MEQPRIRLQKHLWRDGRGLAALSPSSARLDDRSFADMAAFLVRYFAGFPFDKDHFWDIVLIGDPTSRSKGDITFLLAQIATTQPKREYAEALHRLGPDPETEALKPLIVASLRRLDGWYRRLVLMRSMLNSSACVEAFWIDFTAILDGQNANTIASLRFLISQLRQHPAWTPEIDALNLDPSWHIDRVPQHGPDAGHVLSAFSSATEALVTKAVAAIDRSMKEIADHPPHTGLLLAYLKMCSHLRDKLNLVTARHLAFYFSDVLRLAPRPAENDVATVSFELAPQAKPFQLPAGSQLSAGNDTRGQPMLFATDVALDVTHGKVRALMAVRLRMSSITTAPSGGKTQVREVAEINAYPVLNSQDGFGGPLGADQGWPTFGAARGSSPRLVGLSIRSPMFQLSEGERSVDIVMRFVDPGALRSAVDTYLDRIGEKPGSVETKLTRCFRIVVSTARGFVTAAQETIFDRNRGTLRFTIAVPAASPAIMAPPGPIPGSISGLPCVRILLDPHAPVYGYSFFKTLTLQDVSIKVGVVGLATIEINGVRLDRIDALKPFAPFGSPALRGSGLTLTHPDLLDKPLAQVSIKMRWSNLPTPPDSLQSYYTTYGMGTTGESFRLTIAGLVDQSWVPLRAGDVAMFPENEGGTSSEAVWSFSTRGIWDGTRRNAGSLARSGRMTPIIKMTLCSPDYGFGQSLYPMVLGRIVLAQASRGADAMDGAASLPKPPFVPLIDALTIDYHATTTISPDGSAAGPANDRAGIYFFDPFGYEVPLTNAALLPDYPAQGYLFLGLDGLKEAEALSVFFNVQPRAAKLVIGGASVDPKTRRKSLQISCLSGDRWIALTDDNILSDGTEALTRPGLLHLQLPPIVGNHAPTFDARLVWLRIAAEGDPETYGRTLCVECNGVLATRLASHDTIVRPPVLPPGSITKLVRAIPGLSALRQGLATSGGRSEETLGEFRIRVSERLRHKNRAVLIHDYEALVLDRFPSIGDAKCFGAHGSVTVVVAPLRQKGNDDATAAVPEYELQAILDYLRDRSSPCIRHLIVRNPAFEPVRVIAWLQLTAGETNTKIRSVRAAIDRFIAPWIGRPSLPMVIGAPHIDLSGLRTTLSTLPFVTCATGLSITHLHRRRRREIGATGPDADALFYGLDDTARDGNKRSHIKPALPQSVLVPAHHHLRIVGAQGIGYGTIDDDFVVGSAEAGRSAPPFLRPPRRAGIGNLGIGDDFLVRARRQGKLMETFGPRAR